MITTRQSGAQPAHRPGGYRRSPARTLRVRYVPVLDVARGATAGFQTRVLADTAGDHDMRAASGLDLDLDGSGTARAVRQALAAASTRPPGTFLTLPLGATVAASDPVREALGGHGGLAGLRGQAGLAGIVLDVTGHAAGVPVGALDEALADYRRAGALLAMGGHGAAQPELTGIVRFRPAIIRLGRDWVRGIDCSAAKREAVDLIGRLAAQADACVLAEGVESAAELRALAGLGVPLAQGSFIGEARESWPGFIAARH